MAREYIVRAKEEKLAIVKRNLAGETCRALAREIGCNQSQVLRWTKKYLAEGVAGFEPKKRPGDPLSRYRQRKNLTYEEQLQYPEKRRQLHARTEIPLAWIGSFLISEDRQSVTVPESASCTPAQ